MQQSPWEDGETAPVLDGARLIALFDAAFASGRKYPKIVTNVFTIYRAGERAREPGAIQVIAPGNNWVGCIKRDGSGYPSREVAFSSAARDAWAGVADFSNDPAGVAAAYGQTSSRCCFCATEITTEESLAVGYGPICAGRYGLPWGGQEATPAPAPEPEATPEPASPGKLLWAALRAALDRIDALERRLDRLET